MEKVFMSGLLSSTNRSFSEYFCSLLSEKGLKTEFLENTKDIWCRDYMPVKSAKGQNLLFVYDPSYLKGYEKKLTPRNDIIRLLRNKDISFKEINDIKLDGGNVVRAGSKVIITDAIYRENGFKNDKTGQLKLLTRLEYEFETEDIIIIPHQPDDLLSHADGLVRFLDDNTVLINDFSSVKEPKLKESLSYLNRTFGALGGAGFDIIQIPYAPSLKKGLDKMCVAYGIYINYLETEKYIFLPQFGEDFKDKDAEAVERFTALFLVKNKKVVPVNARTIAYGGGVLNCMTWN